VLHLADALPPQSKKDLNPKARSEHPPRSGGGHIRQEDVEESPTQSRISPSIQRILTEWRALLFHLADALLDGIAIKDRPQRLGVLVGFHSN